MGEGRRFCPECGQPLPKPGASTVKLDRRDSDKLRAAATRSSPPPPPPLPLPTVEDEAFVHFLFAENKRRLEPSGDDTLPDDGWLRKHLRAQNDRLQLAGALVFAALLVLAWLLARV